MLQFGAKISEGLPFIYFRGHSNNRRSRASAGTKTRSFGKGSKVLVDGRGKML